jgi:hypothetical protein
MRNLPITPAIRFEIPMVQSAAQSLGTQRNCSTTISIAFLELSVD